MVKRNDDFVAELDQFRFLKIKEINMKPDCKEILEVINKTVNDFKKITKMWERKEKIFILKETGNNIEEYRHLLNEAERFLTENNIDIKDAEITINEDKLFLSHRIVVPASDEAVLKNYKRQYRNQVFKKIKELFKTKGISLKTYDSRDFKMFTKMPEDYYFDKEYDKVCQYYLKRFGF